jgi:cellulose synthase/poly-beta-1,6-N-acetylglucosamine synthase-like glycosyltransferase
MNSKLKPFSWLSVRFIRFASKNKNWKPNDNTGLVHICFYFVAVYGGNCKPDFFTEVDHVNTDFNHLVSVLIPARNEEKNIAKLLNDLLDHDYKNIEILVFNDQSTDKTAEIVTGFSQKDSRVKLINSDGLPEGWLGKNHACHSLSKLAKGKYLLFLDSDVRIGNGIIRQTCTFSDKHKLGLLSIFPRQIMVSAGEKAAVPLMHFILLDTASAYSCA